jgi:hypothetical protein
MVLAHIGVAFDHFWVNRVVGIVAIPVFAIVAGRFAFSRSVGNTFRLFFIGLVLSIPPLFIPWFFPDPIFLIALSVLIVRYLKPAESLLVGLLVFCLVPWSFPQWHMGYVLGWVAFGGLLSRLDFSRFRLGVGLLATFGRRAFGIYLGHLVVLWSLVLWRL